MPTERTRDQNVWFSTIDNNNIVFVPNVTPGISNELYHTPTLHDNDTTLFPPLDGCALTRRSGHGRKKPINHIPRPPNAFILFRSSFIKSQHVSSEVETNHSTLSKIIGLTWQNLPNEERQVWHARAKVALEEHKRKFPSYAFKPIHNKPKALPGQKRKVREVRPKDHTRCAKIAELLVGGKKGLELEVAIQEFDKNHVPEIVTRFEAPITANSYESSQQQQQQSADKRPSISPSTCQRRRSQASPSPKFIDPAQEIREDYYDTPSFNQHSFSPLALSPSFDFNTFPFSCNNNPSPTSFPEILAPAVSPLHMTYNRHNLDHPRPSISIPNNNASFMDEWTQSSSPISNTTDSLPTTPSQLNVPFPESYTPFALEPRSDSPYADHSESSSSSLYSTYPDVHHHHHATFGGDGHIIDVRPVFQVPPCEPDPNNLKTPITQEDLDFSTFMASFPSYSL